MLSSRVFEEKVFHRVSYFDSNRRLLVDFYPLCRDTTIIDEDNLIKMSGINIHLHTMLLITAVKRIMRHDDRQPKCRF